MFLINKEDKSAIKIPSKTFSELLFTERYDLQEWIANNSEILGEKLLIIQKEFSGFDDTNERLDLLALDQTGDLVIIENKLDDSGKDVTWQALKYVSYCAKLTTSEILEIFQGYLLSYGSNDLAEVKIREFFDAATLDEIALNQGDQRIILVAANFRKEVTSTVMWLLEHDVKIRCMKVTPYLFNDNVLLDVEQIIPIKEVESYMIGLAKKKQDVEERKKINAQKITQEMFLDQLTTRGKLIFSELFNFASENDLFCRWGTKGFSLNMELNEKSSFLGLCFGYPPNSVYKQSIYTGFEEINRKVENKDEVMNNYKEGVIKISHFEKAGYNYKWMITEDSTSSQMNEFKTLLLKVIDDVKKSKQL